MEFPQQPAAAAAATAPAAAAQPVLPWMRVPISISAGSGVALADVLGLHPALMHAVQQQLGFSELFPVQAAVWRSLAGGLSTAHDLCICAPTGSGKTLAYALPLLNAVLTGCQPASCHVLRALVVLPTRDLAVQVHSVLHSLGSAAGLNIALAAAQESVAAEAARLATRPSQPGSGPHVLVATPGRLMAHLHSSSASSGSGSSSGGNGSLLSLRQLRFLVVDEADRLLRQDYQGWLPEVLQRIRTSCSSSSGPHQQSPWADALLTALPFTSSSGSGGGSSSNSSRVLKLVVSATLTRDPSKLLRLELVCPRYIALTDVNHRYVLPPALQQYRLVVPAQHKPLALVGLLTHLGPIPTILFASSLGTTHRLHLLLAAVPGLPVAVAEYSSHVAPEQRSAALAAFKSGRVHVLVTSDAMARGMDVSSVKAVINYDPPTYPKVYVHRAGRTARAGSAGAVYSLLKPEDVVHFNGMLRKVQGSRVKQFKLLPAVTQELRPALKSALQQVQELVQLEHQVQKQPASGAEQQLQQQPQQQQKAGQAKRHHEQQEEQQGAEVVEQEQTQEQNKEGKKKKQKKKKL